MDRCMHRWDPRACAIVCFLGLCALLGPVAAHGADPVVTDPMSVLMTNDGSSWSPLLAARDHLSGGANGLSSTADWHVESNQDSSDFGLSVATAGDVNGDGYSDVIVGADWYTSMFEHEGAAFLYLGSADGLHVNPDWMAAGGQTGSEFGCSVAPAGDVNGDGYDDVIIGSPTYTNGESREGRVCVFLGCASGLSVVPVWTFESNRAGANAGYCVSTAGDVNGDGYDDILIGVPRYASGQTDEGRVLCFLGCATGISGASPWRFEADQTRALLGWSVAPAGDVNGDGYGDIIVGAPYATNAGGSAEAGRAYIFRGSATGLSIVPLWTREGDAQYDYFAMSVAGAGDVNCDGYADVIVGAPYADELGTGLENVGRAYLFHGNATAPSQTPSWMASGEHVNDYFGYCVATAGDVDGDLFADVAIGAWKYDSPAADAGAAYVYEGSAAGLEGEPVWLQTGDAAGAGFGTSLATAGDINGDGFSDLIVGAWGISDPEAWEGAAYVYHGQPADPSGVAVWSQTGLLGHGVATAGDVDGDGYGDILISSPSSYGVGRVWEYDGGPNGPAAASAWTATATQYNCRFGWSAATAGDVNGDGYSDVLVGAPLYDGPANADMGEVLLYYGSSTGLSPSASNVFLGEAAGEGLGYSVASAGDVNDDGYGDIIIGAPFYSGANVREGRAFVYLGSPTGIHTTPAWTVAGHQAQIEFGFSVACAGDVNGDGCSDVIVGAPGVDDGTIAGQAFVYLGSPDGLATEAHWVGSFNQAGDAYGYCVSTTGDVNGDGYDDVVVGAPNHDNPAYPPNGGAAKVYLGSSRGLATAWYIFAEGSMQDAHFGAVVGAAGDVNSDGYSDYLWTMYGSDFWHIDSGWAQVVMGAASPLDSETAYWVGNDAYALLGFSASTAGDVNGDGFDDVILGAPGNGTSAGNVYVYEGNGRTATDVGRPMLVSQRTLADQPIAWLGTSDSGTGFDLCVTGRNAGGRTRVRMEWSVAELSVPLSSVPVEANAWALTGTPVPGGSTLSLTEQIAGLDPGSSDHWRVRVAGCSPFFPRTPWMSLPRTVPSEKQLRTMGGPSAITDIARGSALTIACANPGARGARATLAYSLAQRGPVRLSIHDASGRCVATLVDGIEDAGTHSATWNGAASSGVYFARLEAAGRMETTKLVLVK